MCMGLMETRTALWLHCSRKVCAVDTYSLLYHGVPKMCAVAASSETRATLSVDIVHFPDSLSLSLDIL